MKQQIVLIPNETFDDGSIECRNFTLSTESDYETYEWGTVKNYFPDEIIRDILKNLNSKHKYLDLRQYNYNLTSNYEKIIEISWD